MDSMVQDLRFALRTLRKAPGFVFAVILTLGLGIGATTAIFSVVRGVLLRPLALAEPERLVVVWETDNARGGEDNHVSTPNYTDWRVQSRSFAAPTCSASGPWTSRRLRGWLGCSSSSQSRRVPFRLTAPRAPIPWSP